MGTTDGLVTGAAEHIHVQKRRQQLLWPEFSKPVVPATTLTERLYVAVGLYNPGVFNKHMQRARRESLKCFLTNTRRPGDRGFCGIFGLFSMSTRVLLPKVPTRRFTERANCAFSRLAAGQYPRLLSPVAPTLEFAVLATKTVILQTRPRMSTATLQLFNQ